MDMDDSFEHPDVPVEVMELMRDFHDFVRVMPVYRIERIVESYMQDPAFLETIHYMSSEDFAAIMMQIVESEEVQAIFHYAENAPWPWIHNLITDELEKIESRVAGRRDIPVRTGGLSGLIDDILAVLPMDRLKAMYERKMETRPVFRAVMDIIYGEEMLALVHTAKESAVVKSNFEVLLENGIDMEKMLGVVGF